MRKRSRLRWIPLVVAAVLLLASVSIPLPYYSVGPGPAREVVPLIKVEGHPTYDSGRLVMTTVSFQKVTGATAMLAWLDPDEAVVEQDLVYPPGQTVAEEEERSLSQMDTSKIAATSVVLDRLTNYPTDHGEGVLIETVYERCPAEGELFAGDLVGSIGGTAIDDVADASRAIEAVAPGDPLVFHISAGGEERNVTVTRGACPGVDRPVIGIRMVNSFPFGVEISSGEIGGPSAGMMYALGLYDLLTPGDLTHGRLIAGTGTIELDGSVGPIGGITDKIVAARGAGAQVFLVPKDDLAEARTVDPGDMQLISVSSFDDALRALGVPEPAGTAAAA
jgi:PDZ domain-containing protein